MRTRVLGKTGLVVSELSLGTWGLAGEAYGPVSEEDAEAVIRRALELGITLFDTADAYGAGRMEKLLGKVIGTRDDVIVATRIGIDRSQDPPRKRFDHAWLRDAVERSARRMGKRVLPLVMLHNPSMQAMAMDEGPELLQTMVKEGVIKHWGVSAGDSAIARMAIDKGADVVSLAYGLFHAVDVHRLSGELMVSRTALLVHSVLAYGLLAGMWSRDRLFVAPDHRSERWTRPELEERIKNLDAVRFLVRDDVLTLRAAAVRFALANHVVSSTILGPRTVEQLDQLVREAGGGPTYLPDQDLIALPRALAKIGVLS